MPGSGETHNYHLEDLLVYFEEVVSPKTCQCVCGLILLPLLHLHSQTALSSAGHLCVVCVLPFTRLTLCVCVCVCVCLNSQNCTVSTSSSIPTSNRGCWKWTSLLHWHGERCTHTHTNLLIFQFFVFKVIKNKFFTSFWVFVLCPSYTDKCNLRSLHCTL